VFVPHWAYREFMATGTWPDKTIFALEERASETQGSINKTGRFQADLEALAVEVKDRSQFPDTWAYFGFGSETKTAQPDPKAACWQCHNDRAAVEHTFVQLLSHAQADCAEVRNTPDRGAKPYALAACQ
jgi:Cytochrome P460